MPALVGSTASSASYQFSLWGASIRHFAGHSHVPCVIAELAAEREILRRQAGVRAAPADSLRRLQERLAA